MFPDSSYARAVMGRRQNTDLPADHPLSRRAREIARRVGACAPDSVRVEVDPEARDPYALGSFFPTRLWRAHDTKSVVVAVPAHYMEDAADYGDVRVNGRAVDADVVLPSEEEKSFAIAHEISHIKHEDAMFHAVVSPLAMLGFTAAGQSQALARLAWRVLHSRRAPLYALVGAASFMTAGAVLVSWAQEVMADGDAAVHGFASEGERAMQRLRSFNRLAREVTRNRFINDDGDYLLDVLHPSLTTRERYIHYIAQHTR